jgi:hypothetical protein
MCGKYVPCASKVVGTPHHHFEAMAERYYASIPIANSLSYYPPEMSIRNVK